MGKTMRLREYLSTGWRSAVKSAKTDPSPTKAEYNSWVKTAITQIWLLMDGAWKERHALLHTGKNNTVSQSEYNEKIEEYYKKGMKSQGGMNIYSTRVWRNYCKQVRLNHKNYDFEREPTIRSKNQRNLRHRANIRSIHTYYNTKTKNTTTAATKKCRPQWKVLAHSTLPIQFSS